MNYWTWLLFDSQEGLLNCLSHLKSPSPPSRAITPNFNPIAASPPCSSLLATSSSRGYDSSEPFSSIVISNPPQIVTVFPLIQVHTKKVAARIRARLFLG